MPYSDPEASRRYKAEWAKKKYWENPAKARASMRKHPKVCLICGVDYLARTETSRACSRSCSAKLGHLEGRMNTLQPRRNESGRRLHVGRRGATYVQVWVPTGYPGRPQNGWMMEHRVVMQEHLGRPLESWEWVHHRNGNKTDNRVENLQIVSHARPSGLVVCPNCQHHFEVH